MAFNITAVKTSSDEAWQGDNPLNFAFPLLIVQTVLIVAVSRSLGFHFKPLRQPKVIAEIVGFGRLSMVAASAASVVQTGTKEFTSKVKEGGYDHKVSETVNVVASKTTEIGQRTWGIMNGVMAIATQKVGEYTKEGTTSWNQHNGSESNGYYQNFGNGNRTANSSVGGRGSQSSSNGSHYNNTQKSNSWDDWGENGSKKKEAVAPKGSSTSSNDELMMVAGPVAMIPKMMFITKVLVTTENQTPLGLLEVFTKGDSECR